MVIEPSGKRKETTNKNKMESIKDNLSVFKDNAKGTITFVAWRRKIITHAGEWGGETAKQVVLGQLAGVPPDENIDKCNRMYVDLIYNLDKPNRSV